MSVSDVITSLSTAATDGGYTVTRQANAGYDGATGDAITGTITTFSIDAVIEPAQGKRLTARVEGRHTEATILIMTSTALRAPAPSWQADRVMYLGELFEVLQVDGPITLAGDSHYEAYAARLVQP